MENNNVKKHILLKITITLLVIIILISGGYLIYDKIIKKEKVNEETKSTDKIERENEETKSTDKIERENEETKSTDKIKQTTIINNVITEEELSNIKKQFNNSEILYVIETGLSERNMSYKIVSKDEYASFNGMKAILPKTEYIVKYIFDGYVVFYDNNKMYNFLYDINNKNIELVSESMTGPIRIWLNYFSYRIVENYTGDRYITYKSNIKSSNTYTNSLYNIETGKTLFSVQNSEIYDLYVGDGDSGDITSARPSIYENLVNYISDSKSIIYDINKNKIVKEFEKTYIYCYTNLTCKVTDNNELKLYNLKENKIVELEGEILSSYIDNNNITYYIMIKNNKAYLTNNKNDTEILMVEDVNYYLSKRGYKSANFVNGADGLNANIYFDNPNFPDDLSEMPYIRFYYNFDTNKVSNELYRGD